MNQTGKTPPVRLNRLRIYCLLLAGPFVFVAFTGCKGHTHITGTVKSKVGSPVYPVQITLRQGEWVQQVQASTDGKFDIALDHALFRVELKLSAVSYFYKPVEKTFSSGDNLKTIDITMEEVPEPTVAEVRKLRLKGITVNEARKLAELMCRQLPNAAAFPMKSFLSGDDVHDTLVLLSGVARPCLVEHLADSTWMPDSRSEPMADFHAGDAALWILTDAGLDWDIVVPLLDQKEWQGVGVYEYFYWVNKGNHRKVVQQVVKRWLQEHPQCCGSEADFSDNGIERAPGNKITPQRFAELQLAWSKLKPGMDEKLARQLLGPSDGEFNIEPMVGFMDYRSHEKSAAFYFVETPDNPTRKLDFRERDPLRDRYVIVFFSFDGKLVRAFSNVPELPPLYPKTEKQWEAMVEASMAKMY